MRGSWLDFRTGLRQLRRAPHVAVVAVLTLAVGIGGTTAVVSFVAAVLEAAAPVPDMDRRVALWSRNLDEAETKRAVSPGDFLAWRERARTVRDMVAMRSRAFSLSGLDTPIRVSGREVTPGYLEFLGMTPVVGRSLTSDDARPGAPRVVILTDRFWHTQMARRTDLIGTSIRLDGVPAAIVGILPPDPVEDGIFVPLRLDGATDDRTARNLFVWARLDNAVTIQQARAEFEGIGRALAEAYPDTNARWTVNTRPLQEEFVGPQARLVFGLMLLMAIAVLLVACVNVANLLVARGAARQGEMAVRLAMGANRGRLVRQLLIECGIIAALGGAASLLVANAVLGVLVASFPVDSPWIASAGLNERMLLLTAVVSLVATLAAGLAPALAARRTGMLQDLHASGRGGVGSTRRLTRGLVAVQVTMAVMLVMTAGLLGRTVRALEDLDPGFDAGHLLTASVALPERTTEAEAAGWFIAALERASSLPGIEGAGAASRLPFAGSRFNPNRGLVIEGQPPDAGPGAFAVDYVITPGYIGALRLPIQEGRDFTPGDTVDAPLVAIVSQTLARQRWGTRSPLGARLRQGDEPAGTWRTVVGLVADVRNDDADQPPLPYLYLPHAQRPVREMSMVVRTAGSPDAMAPALRRALADFDPDQPLFDVRSMDAILEADSHGSVVLVRVLDAFALVALGLAGLGIWGVATQMIAERTREIGVRVALGATPRQVLSMTARLALPHVALGAVGGLVLGLGVARLLRSILFQVSPSDPATIGTTIVALVAVAAAALAGPAARAARVDPLVALRDQ